MAGDDAGAPDHNDLMNVLLIRFGHGKMKLVLKPGDDAFYNVWISGIIPVMDDPNRVDGIGLRARRKE